ncbi:MAG: flavin reductase family protein [Akkermansiaceae bacterium]|nr:flavin reductase family protein [Akkermansiaceae bacterium]MCF7730321.1 flavin reductase family protein [Akkermansiaceae bacterium]
MARRSLALSKVYGLLEPGPVVLLSTARAGKANLMTLSWHTMMEFEPPLVGCVVSDRNHSFRLLKATRECVINIPTADLAEKVVGCGNTTGADIDKFTVFGLTPVPAALVGAPLIAECFANLECRVADTRMVASYGFFVLEVVRAWLDRAVVRPRTIHHLGHGNFMTAGERIKLRSKMK